MRGVVRSLVVGLALAFAAGALVAVSMSAVDWWRNPAGVFHDASGTRWALVAETAWSWFWPVALAALLPAVLVHRVASRRRRGRRPTADPR